LDEQSLSQNQKAKHLKLTLKQQQPKHQAMKLIAMSNVLAACIALFLVGSTDAKKAGLRQLAGRPVEGDAVSNKPRDRSLGETPECAICKDMYDTLKESTSVYACEATCDTMAEALGGGPEDRTFERHAQRAGRSLCSCTHACSSRKLRSTSRLPLLSFASPRGHGHGHVRPSVRDHPRRIDGGRELGIGLQVRRVVLDQMIIVDLPQT
jgi:hypothetical protein